MTDLKLGILLWSQGTDWGPMVETARRVDRLGYDSLWTWDHLYAIYGAPYQPIFGGYEVLAGWAVATERAKLGLLVGANTFRNPGIVAKSVATLDHISGGRAIAGLGGAWFDLEHTAHGIDFGTGFGQRLDWLDESVGIIRRLLDGRLAVVVLDLALAFGALEGEHLRRVLGGVEGQAAPGTVHAANTSEQGSTGGGSTEMS